MIIRRIAKQVTRRKVAAYARVSTLTEEQEESYETQINYYTKLAEQTEGWEMVGLYADPGISGTSAKKRPEFMRMINDARNGKIDLILCKSVSRFSRNFKEAQELIHELKAGNVEVWFEKEGIHTFDPSTDLIFSMMAAISQEESRSISENVKWSYRKRGEQGIRHIGNFRMLGYDDVDGKLTPNKDAWIVRMIFDEYEGDGEQKCGDWCRFCRAKPICRACANEALALAKEEFLDLDEGAFAPIRASPGKDNAPVFKQPGLIPFHELEEILPTLNRIGSWIEAVFAFVSGEAINNGMPVKGYKVVEGRSKRVFTDLKAVVDTAMQNGFTDLYKKELISLTEFEKLMGKKRFVELLGPYVAKPPGKLALVPDSDPRPPVERTISPEQEFSALPAQDEE